MFIYSFIHYGKGNQKSKSRANEIHSPSKGALLSFSIGIEFQIQLWGGGEGGSIYTYTYGEIRRGKEMALLPYPT